MRALWQRLRGKIARFGLREDGIAAVEFALILPVMLFVYIGSVEASALISMDRRVQSIAGTLGDLVSRADASVTSGDLLDYFRAAGGIMTPYPTDKLRQTVTQVSVSADGKTATVVWSYEFDYTKASYAVGTKHRKDSTFPLPAQMATIAKGKTVIVSEASSSYLPLYGFVYAKPIDLKRENFFMPRFGKPIVVK